MNDDQVRSRKLQEALEAVQDVFTANQLFRDAELAGLGRVGFKVASPGSHFKNNTRLILFDPEKMVVLMGYVKRWGPSRRTLTMVRPIIGRDNSCLTRSGRVDNSVAARYLMAVI